MLAYLIRRVLHGVIVIFLVSIATFGIMQAAPGSPVDIMVGQARVSQEQIDLINHKWGLDRPWYEQYFTWVGNVVQGDFGQSVVRTSVPVNTMVREAAGVTIKLNVISLFLSTIIAIPVGILAATRRNSIFDYIATLGSTLGVALPSFWIALMLIIFFSLKLGWLPATGTASWKNYVMPVMVLASQETALVARLTRGATLEVMRQDYVTTARAKGLGEWVVTARHIVRNALLPVITVLGLRVAYLLSGTIIVETVFAMPGLGRLFIDSVNRLDYQVVQAIVLISTLVVVAANILTDLAYALVDPRIRIR
jgi:ABC-type dipeptide/oligopeptide/nickel transport system permease component